MTKDIYRDLEGLGILKNGVAAAKLDKYNWLTAEDRTVLLTVFFAGEEGLHKKQTKKIEAKQPGTILKLEMAGMICWERDNTGKPMFIVATWKGQDFCEDCIRRERALNHANQFKSKSDPK